jgi:hypothetical protein
MKRLEWLAAIAIAAVLVPGASFAQSEVTGGGFRMVGGFGGEVQGEVQRSAEVELEGGQRVRGEISLRPLTIESDIGRYSIALDKIKMIRFLKPANQAAAGNPDEPGAAPDAAASRRSRPVVRDANGIAMDPLNGGMGSALTRGKVSTTVGKDIIGDIYIPMDLRITLDVGTLYLAAGALRTITLTDARAEEGRPTEPAQPAGALVPHGSAGPAVAPAQSGGPKDAEAERSPISFRQGNSLFVFMPGGNRVAIYDLETKKSQAIELAGSKDAPIGISPTVGQDLLALNLNGSKITRIAVAELPSGTWHTQDLRQPVEGRASPIVGPGVALYPLGRYAYAYSTRAHRWDVAELPEGVRATPSLAIDGVTIQGRGHIYLFSTAIGKWEHIDLRAILDVVREPKK